MKKRVKVQPNRSGEKRDSLDLLAAEGELLSDLFSKWEETKPEGKDHRSIVTAKWDHGTVGKLILEHGAVWLAAEKDIARVLELCGCGGTAVILRRAYDESRPVIDEMAEASFGVPPMEVAVTLEFVAAVEVLMKILSSELVKEERDRFVSKIRYQLGAERADLRSAKFILKHAPTHPGRHHWYDRSPVFVRLHSVFNRLQGFPWGESSIGDRKMALKYDRSISK